ncbi:hypothetical protein ELI_4171 [Eubacterium callanderi]|uniref:Uncharacterized protein n=1 Tax=Eubacterium callanderi TaxID=53442 RepID=E3GQ64_9FIRM|nr:hypothetical protein ELI_4171 [Eubacterium callanderi]
MRDKHLPFFFSFLIYIKGNGYRSPLLFIFLTSAIFIYFSMQCPQLKF